ncbi:hypothetical protein BC939DRAFT_449496 [Gamsiella multidivaricata]|uniref:uncharacterized protein n=1 Tax=Gamsiella multidivaricata TaxID=101098 RepID=UPI0022210206|nr:uncharacterized protein BC939DRAFT_449496 [Gamsiella multidivaricata]KAI7824876.1 hypothetical protein BC939DRAFT_449496 [Gamsiella multidivaricata]
MRFLLVLVLPVLLASIFGFCSMTSAAPVPNLVPRRSPVISAVLGSRRGHGLSLGVGTGINNGSSLLKIHRPSFRRSDEEEEQSTQHTAMNKRSTSSLAAKDKKKTMKRRLHRGDAKPLPWKPSPSSKGMSRRRQMDTQYVPGGNGSGGQYDKGMPYGRSLPFA